MEINYSKTRQTWLIILRIFIGWHFLYEGMIKVLNPHWTAKTYLLDSHGFFSSIFINMAGNGTVMKYVDLLNEWALVLIGAGLVLGIFTRLSCIGGIALLLLYTFSHPPLIDVTYMMPNEGSYFLIDKNIVELAGLGVLFVFPTARIIGIDRYLIKVLPEGFQKFII
jgi:thiosulfate dehydrogenase [quinone] large subunit